VSTEFFFSQTHEHIVRKQGMMVHKMIKLFFFVPWTDANHAPLTTREAFFKRKEECFFLDLDRYCCANFFHLEQSLYFLISAKFGFAVLQEHYILNCIVAYDCLLARDRDIADCDVVGDTATHVESVLDREVHHVDRFGEAVDVRLEHHEAIALWQANSKHVQQRLAVPLGYFLQLQR